MKISTENTYWVYILRCSNGSYYTGYTSNLTKRIVKHINGTSRCKYTRSFKPTHLVQCWQVQDSKSLAMKLEKYIKSYTRERKQWLIANPTYLTQDSRVSVFLGKICLSAII